jgi:hypothetical protein
MANILNKSRVRPDRDPRLALSIRARRALRDRDVINLSKAADEAKTDPVSGRIVLTFMATRDLIAAFKRLRDAIA